MNPILNALNGRSRLKEAIKLANALKNRDADQILDQMAREDAHFCEFVTKYRNTKPEDVLREFGLNPDILDGFK